jgi:hypothetical protein
MVGSKPGTKNSRMHHRRSYPFQDAFNTGEIVADISIFNVERSKGRISRTEAQHLP